MFDFLYKDPVDKKKKIVLLYDAEEKHFSVIKSLKGLMGTAYFCIECNVRYNSKNKHKCTRGCKVCGGGSGDCPKMNGGVICDRCNRICFSSQCYDNHVDKGVCDWLYRCPICNVLVDKKKRTKQRNVE